MTTEQQVLVESVIPAVLAKMAAGLSDKRLAQWLIDENGLDSESATLVVSNVRQVRFRTLREAGKKDVTHAIPWAVGGILVSMLSYVDASLAGRQVFYVASGLMMWGAYLFLRGLIRYYYYSTH